MKAKNFNIKKEINLKPRYDKLIQENKGAIKSLRYLKQSQDIKNQVTALKKNNKELKSEFKDKKKLIFKNNKKEVGLVNKAHKSLKQELIAKKNQLDRISYENLKNEVENLKIRKKQTRVKKYRAVYGTTVGKTLSDKTNKWTRILIIIGIFVLFMVPFWLIITFSTKTNIEAADTTPFLVFKPSFSDGARINYELALESLNFWDSLMNTLILTIGSNILILMFSSMAAWQLVRAKTWYSKVIFYSFVVAMILPFQAIMVPLMSQFNRLEMNETLWGTTIAYIGFGIALSVFMMHGFLKTVPTALEESAAISGMNPFQIFFHVVLPLLKTTFITILVLNIMWIWNDYLLPSLLLQDPYGSMTLQVRLIKSLVTAVASDLKALSAGVVLLVIPPIAFFIFAQKKMISGITKGAIK